MVAYEVEGAIGKHGADFLALMIRIPDLMIFETEGID